jgi:hypothetical protein
VEVERYETEGKDATIKACPQDQAPICLFMPPIEQNVIQGDKRQLVPLSMTFSEGLPNKRMSEPRRLCVRRLSSFVLREANLPVA